MLMGAEDCIRKAFNDWVWQIKTPWLTYKSKETQVRLKQAILCAHN